MAAILIVCALQIGACTALVLPALYNELGALPSTAFLGATLWLEAFLFLEFRTLQSVGLVLNTVTLALLALVRVDRQARNAKLQVPTSSTLLNAESVVKNACAVARLRQAGPLASTVAVFYTMWYGSFWRATRHQYEHVRAVWHLGVATCALLLLLTSLDGRAQPLRWPTAWHLSRRKLL